MKRQVRRFGSGRATHSHARPFPGSGLTKRMRHSVRPNGLARSAGLLTARMGTSQRLRQPPTRRSALVARAPESRRSATRNRTAPITAHGSSDWRARSPAGTERRSRAPGEERRGPRASRSCEPNQEVGTFRGTAVVADAGICAAIGDRRFQAHLTSVPRNVPTQCWRPACLKLRNLLSIMGLQDTRRVFKPVAL